MTQSSNQTPVNLLTYSFKNPLWPPNFINADNVLNYFCDPANIFYDKSSCNAMLMMQMGNQFLDNNFIQNQLINMRGIQYVVVGVSHPMYIICKQARNSREEVTPHCYYYVMNGVVYQCPDMYSSIQSRLVSALHPMKKALTEVIDLCRFNVAKGYSWEFKNKVIKKDDDEEEREFEDPVQARSTNFQRSRTEQLIKIMMQKHSIPENNTQK
uniref:Mediator of RNA polymerase II transcription subunit 6 n=1 Tax=Parastrongyloides trichosuri TaxID=131310 RepID=A0A0N4ZRE7_PARTI